MNCILTVDQSKCVRCGICAEICPSCIITMGDNGPELVYDGGCMACGHCVAICPTGAMNNNQCQIEEQLPITSKVLDKDTAMDFLRTRRSIRNFTDKKIDEETFKELLNAGRYAPTAANTQGLYYIVISDKELIKKIADTTADWMEKEIEIGSPRKRYFTNVLRTYRDRNIDIIARNAPYLIIALARRLNETAISNCDQAWAYINLFAPTIGIGTTVAGFIQTCGQDGYEPLRELLEVPKKQIIVGALMAGYPKYKYKRLPERQHLKVEFR